MDAHAGAAGCTIPWHLNGQVQVSTSNISALILPHESRKISSIALEAGRCKVESIDKMGELCGLVVQLIIRHESVQQILFTAVW